EQAARTLRDPLIALSIGTRTLKGHLQGVALQDAARAKKTRRFIAAARLRRYVTLRNIASAKDDPPPAPPEDPATSLAKLEATLRSYAEELQKAAATDERKKLEAEHAELSDRALVSNMMPTVLDELARLKKIQLLRSCLSDTTTNTITNIGNEIADT